MSDVSFDPRSLTQLFLLHAPVRDKMLRRVMRHLGRRAVNFPREFVSQVHIVTFVHRESESALLCNRAAELWQPWLDWKQRHLQREEQQAEADSVSVKNVEKYIKHLENKNVDI